MPWIVSALFVVSLLALALAAFGPVDLWQTALDLALTGFGAFGLAAVDVIVGWRNRLRGALVAVGLGLLAGLAAWVLGHPAGLPPPEGTARTLPVEDLALAYGVLGALLWAMGEGVWLAARRTDPPGWLGLATPFLALLLLRPAMHHLGLPVIGPWGLMAALAAVLILRRRRATR